jgi:hypothetical protein|tara:strand:- start:999 stop:1262 length:264 start_codon:yes stop_codon:yes gene_type:complete
MLDNSLFFSLLVSSISTLVIYFLTNRRDFTNESNYDSKELLKIFSIIFIVCFGISYLKNSNFQGQTNPSISMRSGESLLTHSSRPPF